MLAPLLLGSAVTAINRIVQVAAARYGPCGPAESWSRCWTYTILPDDEMTLGIRQSDAGR